MTSVSLTIKRIVYHIPVMIVLESPMFLVPKTSPFLVLILIKTILPMFQGNFYVFGLMKYIILRAGLGNDERETRDKMQ